MTTARDLARRLAAVVCVGLVLRPACGAAAELLPDAMMRPILELTTYMRTLDSSHLDEAFVSTDLTVMENFAPYLFAGPTARQRWEAAFREHATRGHLRDLTVQFGSPATVERQANVVYFSLPTTWRGTSDRRRFVEHGAWSFVLSSTPDGWRIRHYAWAVTDIKIVERNY